MLSRRTIIKGTPISGGLVLGQARVILPGDVEFAEITVPVSRVSEEIEALEQAVAQTIEEIHELLDSAGKKIGGPVAKIFDAQLLIADDEQFLNQVKHQIRSQRRNAGFIYNSLVRSTTAPLKSSPDSYMQQMATDIEAVAQRVLSHLSGHNKSDQKFPPHTILVGKMFTPGDILSYRKRKAIGFLVGEGGVNSHMALISRALRLPMVMAHDVHFEIVNDAKLIIDGTSGEVIVNPSDSDWSEYQKRKKRQGPAAITRIRKLADIPPVTADGKVVHVGANLTLRGPADDVLSERKIPVGLYRTEFLYLANYDFPDEDYQFQYYYQIAEKYADTTVTFRVFDLGYDKLVADTGWPSEDNPALGWRGMRAMLDMNHIFKTQLGAILRASVLKNVKILLPMITDVSELEQARKLISQAKFRLRKNSVPFDEDIEVGIMIEVPSAAMTADILVRKADFVSIGTNDLAQYTLAADRTNNRVSSLYSSYHPSVLKLIRMIVEAARRHGKSISVCGEMAGDLLALPLFVGMELDLLSMNPARIFDVCRMVRKMDSSMARHLLNSVLSSDTQQQVIHKLQTYKNELDKMKTIRRRKHGSVDT
ncbi:MAG: phosphoenolpyruvate--protein phosphotransferase [Candidatus Zixiibacteriota bacterium]|nr:MAG: phosphoenolpyruvate--protein phosphotransferase [candidate division Zixibacteria bacterium]